ncbi:MAG TPA: ELWxxDGT repeat protein [Thermoanaerobaculia bacterium]|nr:ELWxxDGT repeat protein [Thermoanaerobaculia bacterium]
MKNLKLVSISLVLLIGLIGLVGLASAAGAQPVQQVRNLYPDDGYSRRDPVSSPAYQFVTLGGRAFFVTDGQVGLTDGSAAGTRILYGDPFPGSCFGFQAQLLGTARSLLFWLGCSSEDQLVLWRSDGTVAGTFPLTNPRTLRIPFPRSFPGDSPGDPTYAFAGGSLYFQGCALSGDCSLFRTDGTVQGTQAVEGGERSFGPVASLGNRIFFLSRDDNFNGTLAVTDGTAAGTVHLSSFGNNFNVRRFAAAGGKLFFLAGNGDEGEELWVSDGTAAGTRAVSHFVPSSPFNSTGWLKPAGNRVYFLADDVEHGVELWRSDGTAAGTARITEIGYHTPFHESMRPSHVEETAGGRVVFLATDDLENYKLGVTSGAPESTAFLTEVCPRDCGEFNSGFNSTVDLVRSPSGRVVFRRYGDNLEGEVWSTDGTAAGTVRLAGNVSGRPAPLQNGVFFFSGVQLWRSDGTPAGTGVFSGLPPRVFASFRLRDMAMAGGKVVFPADHPNYGTDLWVNDGRVTELLADFDHESGKGSSPSWLTELDGQLLFRAVTPGAVPGSSFNVTTLWRSGGSAETTVPIPRAPTQLGTTCGPQPPNPFRLGGHALFAGPGAGSCESSLWTTDGTAEGTRSLGLSPFGKVVFQNQIFFLDASLDLPEMTALWKNDGTPGGTVKAFDLPAEARGARDLTAAGPELYFLAEDQEGASQVWRSDGTLAGTRQITSFMEDDFVEISPRFVRAGASVYFAAGLFSPDDLWRTDGTAGGTIRLRRGSFHEPIGELLPFKGDLFFFQLGDGGDTLFRSDGTPEGTGPLLGFRFVDDAIEHHPVVFGDHLFFVVDDGVHGNELWQTDGTAPGTALVRDIAPGESSSRIQPLTAAGGRLFFQADDAVHGAELWQSDGTEAGTRLVQDLNPGIAASHPAELTPVGDRLFFSADDGVTGRELWVLPLGAAGPCQPSDTVLCLSGGRFRVEAQWKTPAGQTDAAHAKALSADTGYFWFFDPANVETVVKVLDARGVNGHQWVFYGALSNVEYSLTVTDTQTGLARRYFNPQGHFASVGDTHAFGPQGAAAKARILESAGAAALVSERVDAAAATGVCVPAAARLCLNGGRFAVEAQWKLPERAGNGRAVRITGDTGYFWFFQASNVEAVVKVLDATAVNGHFWVFYGALSNVEYDIVVTDTMTGKVRTYKNPKGRLASVGDTRAF